MTTWEELLKNRKPVASLQNSAHMLECMAKVREKFPDAEIQEVGKQSWRLVAGDQPLSNAYNSHYKCWQEALEVMRVAD